MVWNYGCLLLVWLIIRLMIILMLCLCVLVSRCLKLVMVLYCGLIVL